MKEPSAGAPAVRPAVIRGSALGDSALRDDTRGQEAPSGTRADTVSVSAHLSTGLYEHPEAIRRYEHLAVNSRRVVVHFYHATYGAIKRYVLHWDL